MPNYQVIDKRGIPFNGQTLKLGQTFIQPAHGAQVRAWLRFQQIREVKPVEPKQTASGTTATPPAQKPVVDVSDAARKLAEEHSIDLATIKGTGSDGTIIKADVEAAIEAAKN
ncbi:E3 binding domain-containing protein [Luteolibacter pohnpeiensis]|uniref:E3 binding domain-containing protein n=1 Tax=Luteolibacter pohnpeiensis TaxID=454153 RepID=A0A934SEU7_9BACT|nr:E3 binding domain-containing protein [Luteolibacter pohnpeiensis]MBK1884604.1 E3 binding domain-containing protein [Luteolibacter pohnpeiensis]